MTKKEKIEIMKNRLATLQNSEKNFKCGGVVRRIKREIRNLEKEA